MTDFTMRIAGRVAAVSAIYESTRSYCADYLCEDAADFEICITPSDIAFEREKSEQEDIREGKPRRSFADAYLETIAVQRRLAEHLFQADTLLFHGSVVEVDGEAFLFTAKSGTGKSTHTMLWRTAFGDRARMINDDKPFLQVREADVIACGSPWMGKHGLGGNVCAPLRAICILTRGTKNSIRPISPSEAVPMLLQQSNRPMDKRLMPRYLALLDALSARVAFYQMACTMEPEAAIMAYEAMKG